MTDADQALVGYARRATLELDRARAEIAGSAKGISGLVTLGLLPKSIDLLSSALVTEVRRSYPAIRLAYRGSGSPRWIAPVSTLAA